MKVATKDEEVIATLTIKAPGAMTERGRKQIVDWLRYQARCLVKHGEEYTNTGSYQARYWAVKKASGK